MIAAQEQSKHQIATLQQQVEAIEKKFDGRELATRVERFVLKDVSATAFPNISVFLRKYRRNPAALPHAKAKLEAVDGIFTPESLEDLRVVLQAHKYPASSFAHENRPDVGDFDAHFAALRNAIDTTIASDDLNKAQLLAYLDAHKEAIKQC